jgi:hypothetical protein
MGDAPIKLARLQEVLYRLITSPEGVAAGLSNEAADLAGGLEGLIVGDEQLPAEARLGIYADAYFYRLLDVFKEEYPATLAIIGDANFHNLVTSYLIEYPPSTPSIFYAGQYLPQFLTEYPLKERYPFLPELAQLERSVLESFHSADAFALDGAAMAAVAPQEWPAIRMQTHPAVRIVDCEWRVERVLRAVEAGERWETPERGPVTILIWRQKAQVFYREMEIGEIGALKLAREGATFATMCEVIASEVADTEPLAQINRVLGRWLAAGLLISNA